MTTADYDKLVSVAAGLWTAWVIAALGLWWARRAARRDARRRLLERLHARSITSIDEWQSWHAQTHHTPWKATRRPR